MSFKQDPFWSPQMESSTSLECHFCSFSSYNSLEFQNHTMTHMKTDTKPKIKAEKKAADVKPVSCKSCYVMCTSAAALKKHEKEFHPEEKVKKPRTKQEARRSSPPKPKPKAPKKAEQHYCATCDNNYATLGELRNHFCVLPGSGSLFGNSNPRTDLITCTQCGQICVGQSEYDDHMRMHAPSNMFNPYSNTAKAPGFDIPTLGTSITAVTEKTLKCPFNCGYTGARDDLLKAHLERKHGAQSASNSSKALKVKDEKPVPPKKVQVSKEQKQTKQLVVMKAQKQTKQLVSVKAQKQTKQLVVMKAVEVEEKAFKCGMCDYAGAKKENLKGHMQRIHGAQDNKPAKRKVEETTTKASATFMTVGGMAFKVEVGQSKTKKRAKV